MGRWPLAAIVMLALAGCDRTEPDQPAPANTAATPPASSAGSSTASFDCAAARGQAQELICGDSNLAAMDREAARIGSGDSAWTAERDNCWKDDELRHCVMASTMTRIHRLRQAGPVAAGGISIGPVAYRCTGIEGPVSATFVNSDPGAVALDWSGVVIAIDHVGSASGARYEGRWDGEPVGFWTKGDEATLTLSGKGDLACRVEATPAG